MDTIKVAHPSVGREEVEAASEALLSGQYISGKRVARFEELFAASQGIAHAAAFNSGTAALHTALAALGVGMEPGDEVIVPPLTFFSTVSAVIHQYAVPVFADINPESYCLDPKDVKKRITKRTKAIIPVHLYGNAVDMDELMALAKAHDIKVVEDCAQATGTRYKGTKVGNIGDIGIFSFFATKHITTGEGGMLITNNKEWAEQARMVRSHGLADRDNHNVLGYNYRMNEIAAAIGIEQLKKLDRLNDIRINNSLYLLDKLKSKNIPWMKIPKLSPHVRHTFFWCPIQIKEDVLRTTTKELIGYLKDSGIETRNRYWEPLYKQKILIEKEKYPHRVNFASNNIDYSSVHLENAEAVAGKIIGLPNHPGLGQKELARIVEVLARI